MSSIYRFNVCKSIFNTNNNFPRHNTSSHVYHMTTSYFDSIILRPSVHNRNLSRNFLGGLRHRENSSLKMKGLVIVVFSCHCHPG